MLLITISLLWPCGAFAQLQIAQIRGVLLDEQRRPLATAHIRLSDPQNQQVAAVETDQSGRFSLAGIAPGSYILTASVSDLTLVTERLVVRGALPIELTLVVGTSAVREDVVVRGDASANTVEQPWSIAGDAIRAAVSSLPGQRVQNALASLPGWMAEDNGLLHVRGVDDGLLYVQDGIPIYARLDRLFGTAPDSAAVASITVIDGYIPPEFGFKSGGVVQVRSASGLEGGWTGSVEVGLADRSSRHAETMMAGPVGASTGLMLTASAERSARFLDPVTPENFHNTGQSHAAGAQLTSRRGLNLFTWSLQHARSQFDVPHDEDQELAGQDQRQRVSQWTVSGSWQRVVSDSTVWQLSAYRRSGGATLASSLSDTPVTSGGTRGDVRTGVLWSVARQRGRHLYKVGAEGSLLHLDEQFTFAVTDLAGGAEAGLSTGALAFTRSNPFIFSGTATPWLIGAFAQDSFRVSNALSLDYGVRLDRSKLLVSTGQISPRAGLSYRVGSSTTIRVALLRLFQPPQSENLLLASSPAAQALSPFAGPDSAGGAALPPERQTALETSIARSLGNRWHVDVAAWIRRGTDVNDPNVLFGTTVTFPNSVARQHAHGFDLRLNMEPWRGWTLDTTYSHARVVQYGPVTGGLFLEDDVASIDDDGDGFAPDHDQRHALGIAGTYGPAGARCGISGKFRYRSGTPMQLDDEGLEDLAGRSGAETVDQDSGRVRPQIVADIQAQWRFARKTGVSATAVFWMDNVFNQRYAFNFGNPFSGTHFGAPRRVGVTVRVSR
ncbi:MAG: TonB-dependent receptor [Vicinamibacterales bacterium]